VENYAISSPCWQNFEDDLTAGGVLGSREARGQAARLPLSLLLEIELPISRPTRDCSTPSSSCSLREPLGGGTARRVGRDPAPPPRSTFRPATRPELELGRYVRMVRRPCR
jgi:hypothetical protein